MSAEPLHAVERGGRLVISMPHVGLHRPGDLPARLTAEAAALDDADWHVDRLYAPLAAAADASTLAACWSRWYVDLNRAEDDRSLYPGQATTGLFPAGTFDGVPLYRDGLAPDAAEREMRLATAWRPYHRRLGELLDRARAAHGRAVLLEAHSIRSRVPRLFEGRLPDISVGTDDGRSCRPELAAAIRDVLSAQEAFSWVIDGRFKGGHITRHFGRPDGGVDAVQIELAQVAYLDEVRPERWDEARAGPLRALLTRIVDLLAAG